MDIRDITEEMIEKAIEAAYEGTQQDGVRPWTDKEIVVTVIHELSTMRPEPAPPNPKKKRPEKMKVPPTEEVALIIREVCDEMCDFLQGKNSAYGNSIVDPLKVFSKLDAGERLGIRMDDKLSRMLRGHGYSGDDDAKDLLGYLIMKFVLERIISGGI